MLSLYPNIKPYKVHNIKVDAIHTIYVEECGTSDGIPVLMIHGGPGAPFTVDSRRFFDPEKYRIILFDQRGCGRSTPHAELKNNETKYLLEDMEQIRVKLKIKQWLLFGGSWGAMLALLYAQANPTTVTGMVVRGTFLGREQDIKWFLQDGAPRVFPDEWKNFIKPISNNSIDSILLEYYKLLNGSDDVSKMYAAKTWSTWEAVCSTFEYTHHIRRRFVHPRNAFTTSLFECQYFMKDLFIKKNTILDDCSKISHIPGVIIHGRYDMVCPLDNAYLLHKVWEGSELQIVRNAGHSGMEPGIIDAVIHTTNYIAK